MDDLNDLLEWVREQYELASEQCVSINIAEREADYWRGRAALCKDLISQAESSKIADSDISLDPISSYTVPV